MRHCIRLGNTKKQKGRGKTLSFHVHVPGKVDPSYMGLSGLLKARHQAGIRHAGDTEERGGETGVGGETLQATVQDRFT